MTWSEVEEKRIKELWLKAPPLKPKIKTDVSGYAGSLERELTAYPKALDKEADAMDAMSHAMKSGLPSSMWIASYGKTVSAALAAELVSKSGLGIIDDPVPVEPPPEAFFIAYHEGEVYQYIKRSAIAIGDDLDIDPEDLGFIGMRPADELLKSMTEKIELMGAEMTMLQHELAKAEAVIVDLTRAGASVGVATGTFGPSPYGYEPYRVADPVADPYWVRPHRSPIDPSEPLKASWDPSYGPSEGGYTLSPEAIAKAKKALLVGR